MYPSSMVWVALEEAFPRVELRGNIYSKRHILVYIDRRRSSTYYEHKYIRVVVHRPESDRKLTQRLPVRSRNPS